MIANLTVSEDAKTLKISTQQGTTADVAASTLRNRAMDAASRKERIENGAVRVIEGIQITAITRMGSSGVNIQFSDGHQKAIFPYSYLKEIAFSTDN